MGVDNQESLFEETSESGWEELLPEDFAMPPVRRDKRSRQGASPSPVKRSTTSMVTTTKGSNVNHSVWLGLCVRLSLSWFLPWAMDEGNLLPGVAYTDIDYHVFTDAAAYIQEGKSPFQRTTYRYTPFLAALLSPFSRSVGRYLFCVADTVCGWIIVEIRRHQRVKKQKQTEPSWRKYISVDLEDALWWLYNPLAINICTRGSAESLIVLLPVLLTVGLLTIGAPSSRRVALAGVFHGVAIHCKLYPIIYSLSLVCFIGTTYNAKQIPKWPTSLLQTTDYLMGWVRCLLTPLPIVFAGASAATAIGLTALAVYQYDYVALEEGLLYHFARVDHRHNYSMHWYWIYLGLARQQALGIAGVLLLLPQAILLLTSSLWIAPVNLCLALFVQTFLFVAQNKVITAQYFSWYLCLLPLCSNSLALTRQVCHAIGFLLLSVVLWLASAYCLEMQGMAFHRVVWLMSVIFFAANLNLLGALLESSAQKKKANLVPNASDQATSTKKEH